MPPVPELRNILRFIWGKEIDRNLDIEQASDSPRHIAVTAEIEIDLKSVKQEQINTYPSP